MPPTLVPPARATAAPRRLGGEIALALAGGGPFGAVWEIGALRALEEACDGLDLTALDRYVGVSAGSFVAACLANGIGTHQLVRMLFRHVPGEIPFKPSTFFQPAVGAWARRGLRLPGAAMRAAQAVCRHPDARGLSHAVTVLGEALPVGVFDNEPIRDYVQRLFTAGGRVDDFRELGGKRLVVTAADLTAGEAIAFGTPGHDDVPISQAVQASTAVPGLYTPVWIDGRPYVDGALFKTVNASAVLDDDVGLLLVLNPLAPVDASTERRTREGRSTDLVSMGIRPVLAQTVRAVLASRLRTAVDGYAHRWPSLDVALVEPAPHELGFLFTDVFSFRERERICALAYDATRRDLLRHADALAPKFARHGLTLRRDVLADDRRTLWQGVGLRESRSAEWSAVAGTALARLRRAARRLDPTAPSAAA